MIAGDVVRKLVLLILACSFLGTLFFLYLHYSRTGSLPAFPFDPDKLLQIIAVTTVIGLLAFHIHRLLIRLLNWKTNFLLWFLTGFVVNVALAVALILFVGTFYVRDDVDA